MWRRGGAAAVAGLLGLLVLLGVIIQQQRPSTRPESLKPTELFEGGDPALDAETQLAGRVRAAEARGVGLGSAAKLLMQAREGYNDNNAKVEALIRHARREDRALGSPAHIAREVQQEVRRAFEEGRAAPGEGPSLKGLSALHVTRGWPHAGGAMPTDFAEPATWGERDESFYPQQAVAWGGDDGAPDGGSMVVGVVGGGPKKYPDGFDESGEGSVGEAHSDPLANPFYWFMKGAKQGGGGGTEWDMPDEGSDGGYPQEIRDPVKKLIAIKKQREGLDRREAAAVKSVYSQATGGGQGFVGGESSEEVSYMHGFLQGAVEASKRSIEQQGQFAKQLQAQGALVGELEGIVRELEEAMRKANWGKTEQSIRDKEGNATAGQAEQGKEGGGAGASAAGGVGEAAKEPAATPAPATTPAPAATPAPATTPAPAAPEAPKVFNLEFYMEALCPACRSFATTVLPSVLSALEKHINLTMVPFGNADVVNGTIVCQHGADECRGNRIELCLMARKATWQDWFPAIKCIESSKHFPYNASKICLPQYGFDVDDVLKCADGDEGELLHLAAAKQTLGLNPSHEWTPWIVLDGKPVKHVNQLMTKVCGMLPKEQTEHVQACNPKFKDVNQEALTALQERKGFCYPHKALLGLA